MAITRYDIGGNFASMKAALEALVPDFFASVEIDNDVISCKDSSGNVLFSAAQGTGAVWNYRAYKDANTYVLSTTYGSYVARYMYKTERTGAFIVSETSTIIIGKTNTGKTAIAIGNGNSSSTTRTIISVACWGDDTQLTSDLVIAQNYTTAMIGNQCLFVPIPLHGTYSDALYMTDAYFLPMAQSGMRNVVQQLVSGDARYITDGFTALMDI